MSDDNPQTKLRDIIGGAPLGKITNVELIGQGYVSLAYKITSSEGEFIALTPKKGMLTKPDYANYFVALKELEAIDYKYAPRAVFLDSEHSTVIMTLAAGEAIEWANNSDEDQQKQIVENLVNALLAVRKVSFENYSKKFADLTGKELPVVTLQEDVRRYTTGFFQTAQKGKPDPELTAFLAPRVTEREATAQNAQASGKPVFIHGDTTPENILVNRSDLGLTLIDWDASHFNHFPEDYQDFGLGYPFLYVTVLQKFKDFALQLTSERTGLGLSELRANLWRYQELGGLSGILWAYAMHAQATAGQIKDDPAKFLKIAHERIDKYQQLLAERPE